MDGERPHNEMSGSMTGILVQSGTITGDLHFHLPAEIVRKPRELPIPIDRLVNQERVLRELAASVDDRPELDRPLVKAVRGAQGSGKTTVALYWLAQCVERYPDGQLYASLG